MNALHHKSSIKFRRTVGTLGIAACLLSASVAQASGPKCYNFNNPEVGTRYEKGQSLDLRHAKINIQQFLGTNGEPSMHPDQHAEISSGNQPQAGAPSLRMVSIVSQIVPKKVVKRITLNYAENTGGAYVQNFGVNGDRRVLQGGLAQINKQTFGKPRYGGSAQVFVTAKPSSGNYIQGTVDVKAAPGGSIKYVAFGGHSNFFVDRVCMYTK